MANLTRVATIQLNERKASPDGLKRFPVTLSTETPVPRRGMFGERFDEILSHAPGAVDLSRAPIPLIESHDSRKVNVGIVTNLRIENKKLRGDLVLGKSARAKELADDIDAGIISGVSVGYAVNRIPDEGDVRIASRWTPYELSIVSVPADINAGINRSATNNPTRSNNVSKKQQAQDEGNGSGGGDVAQKERERVDGIRHSVRTAKLETSIGDELIRSGVSLDQARSQVIDILAARSDAFSTTNHVTDGYRGSITGGETGGERFVRGASAWLYERSGNKQVEQAKNRNLAAFKDVELNGGEFRGMTLYDLARESLERNGVRTRGMDRQKLVGLALTHRAGGTTGDFPILLENVMNKTLQASFALQPDSWTKVARSIDVRDFRASNFYRSGSFGTLSSVAESQEYTNKVIPDGAKLSISTATKGNIISLSRRSIVDDDMSALADLAVKLGRAARLSIESDVYALLAQNGGLGPTQSDGQPFFHSNRANINGTGSALSVNGIDADRVIMARQMDLGSNDYLDLKPAVLLVPTELGGAARVLNDASYDVTASTAFETPNKVRGLFREVVDSPRLSGTRRYLFADPSVCPAIVVAFLEGQGQAPVIETQDGWRIDGVEWKCRIDYRAQMFDPKGGITNAGV